MIAGDKSTVHDVLAWLLGHMDALKQRAYLAKYLVPVDVPHEFVADPEIDRALQECQMLMTTFKGTVARGLRWIAGRHDRH